MHSPYLSVSTSLVECHLRLFKIFFSLFFFLHCRASTRHCRSTTSQTFQEGSKQHFLNVPLTGILTTTHSFTLKKQSLKHSCSRKETLSKGSGAKIALLPCENHVWSQISTHMYSSQVSALLNWFFKANRVAVYSLQTQTKQRNTWSALSNSNIQKIIQT